MLNKICRTFTYLKHLFKVFFNWWMRSVLLCVWGGGWQCWWLHVRQWLPHLLTRSSFGIWHPPCTGLMQGRPPKALGAAGRSQEQNLLILIHYIRFIITSSPTCFSANDVAGVSQDHISFSSCWLPNRFRFWNTVIHYLLHRNAVTCL